MTPHNLAQRAYCDRTCTHLKASSACRTVCPLLGPHITREDRASGTPGRLQAHVETEMPPHSIDLADCARLLHSGLLVHCYQDGPAEMRPGQLVPTRERILTGTLHLDRDGNLVRLHLFDRPEKRYATIPAWLEQVANEQRAIAEIRELPEDEGR